MGLGFWYWGGIINAWLALILEYDIGIALSVKLWWWCTVCLYIATSVGQLSLRKPGVYSNALRSHLNGAVVTISPPPPPNFPQHRVF